MNRLFNGVLHVIEILEFQQSEALLKLHLEGLQKSEDNLQQQVASHHKKEEDMLQKHQKLAQDLQEKEKDWEKMSGDLMKQEHELAVRQKIIDEQGAHIGALKQTEKELTSHILENFYVVAKRKLEGLTIGHILKEVIIFRSRVLVLLTWTEINDLKTKENELSSALQRVNAEQAELQATLNSLQQREEQVNIKLKETEETLQKEKETLEEALRGKENHVSQKDSDIDKLKTHIEALKAAEEVIKNGIVWLLLRC